MTITRPRDTTSLSRPKLQAEALTVERNGRVLVKHVSFEAQGGELLAIVGPNGAGKTSLLKALAGALPYSGRAVLNGQELTSVQPSDRARLIAYVPQKSQLRAPMLAREVVGLARFAHRPLRGSLDGGDKVVVEQALIATSTAHLAARRFTELSGGEQQRVLLARALATGARTLLLDEPGSSLDVQHQLLLFEELRRLRAKDYCLIVVLHELDEVRRYADRALLLHNGGVLDAARGQCVVDGPKIPEAYGVSVIPNARIGFEITPNRAPKGDA